MKARDPHLFSLDNLYGAYRACRKRKRNTLNAVRFEAHLLDELQALHEALIRRTYRPTRSICFVQHRPKLREIFAADFRDRVVHHLLVAYLEELFERRFIWDSYACRRGKGLHAAVQRLRGYVNRVTGNGSQRAWYLKEDISGFFMNIDKKILYRLICRHTPVDEALWLAKVIIFHECTGNYTFKGDPALLSRIPDHKTLFKVPAGKGLPIGNLTSQFFANVYLNELDQFVKRELRCKFYIRYCDDFVILDRDPRALAAVKEGIEAFLREQLLLCLNTAQHRLRPVNSGIDFLGYIVRRRYMVVRRRAVNHLQEKLVLFERRLAEYEPWPRTQDLAGRKPHAGEPLSAVRPVRVWRYPPVAVCRLRSVMASYLGHFKWADAKKLVSSLFAKHPVLRACFLLRRGRLIPRYLPFAALQPPRYASKKEKPLNLRQTYRWWVPPTSCESGTACGPFLKPLWTNGYPHWKVLVFFPVGRFYEFYDQQALAARDALGLRVVSGLRGFKHGCGFHRRYLGRYLRKARGAGWHVALMAVERSPAGICSRHLAAFFRSVAPAGNGSVTRCDPGVLDSGDGATVSLA